MKTISIAFVAVLVMFAAPRARATSTHWLYIQPAACSYSDGTGSYGPGGAELLMNGGAATCEIRIPQGATMVGSRVFATTYGTGNKSQYFIETSNYTNPMITNNVASWTATGNQNWASATAFSKVIDNDNNVYYFQIQSPNTGAYAYSSYLMIEITYTTPT